MKNDKSNKNTYESRKIIDFYNNEDNLQEPEKKILDIIKKDAKNKRMLDIGVGCARTTKYFAYYFNEYVGIDYSKGMVDQSKKKYPKIKFFECDARNMDLFKDDYFDFVLFSFNGIDYVSDKDRAKILKEMKRVCKKNGIISFSSHNLFAIHEITKINFRRNPFKLLKEIIIKMKMKLFVIHVPKNFESLKKLNYRITNDGSHQFRLKTYFVNPQHQLKQLKKLDFSNIKVFGLSGDERDPQKLNTDAWLYYFFINGKSLL